MNQQAAVYTRSGTTKCPKSIATSSTTPIGRIHKFIVAGSWSFFIVAVVAHIFVWLWRPW